MNVTFKSHVIITDIYKVYHNSQALNDIHALPNIDLTWVTHSSDMK